MLKIKDGFNGQRSIVVPPMVIKQMENDPLVSMLHITDIGYYPNAVHHFRERPNAINQFVFIYCIEGSGWYRLNQNTYTLSANQYVILPAGIPHAYASNENEAWTIYWIHFKGNLASYYAKDASQPREIKPEIHSRIMNRINLFEEIFNTLKSGYQIENLHYATSLFHYYLGSLRYIQQYRDANCNTIADKNAVAISIHFMKENIEKHITLQDIAQHIGYSVSHFSMLFKKETGHSPLSYLNLLKVQTACFLLDTTDMKINQICYKIGIEDPYYFSRLFTKIMYISPREYRKRKDIVLTR